MNRRKKVVAYRRKREGKTDYRKRLELLKSGVPRLVVRCSLKNIRAQLVEYHPDGDRVLVAADGHELMKSFGLQKLRRNTSVAYLVGLLIGKKAVAKKLMHAVLDIGMQVPVKHAVVYATLKGAVDAGMKVPHDPTVLPDQKRLQGEHLKNAEFAQVKARLGK